MYVQDVLVNNGVVWKKINYAQKANNLGKT